MEEGFAAWWVHIHQVFPFLEKKLLRQISCRLVHDCIFFMNEVFFEMFIFLLESSHNEILNTKDAPVVNLIRFVFEVKAFANRTSQVVNCICAIQSFATHFTCTVNILSSIVWQYLKMFEFQPIYKETGKLTVTRLLTEFEYSINFVLA